MSDPTRHHSMKSWDLMRAIRRTLPYGILTAFPLCGLVLFFEMTRPANVIGEGFVAMHFPNIAAGEFSDGAEKASLSGGRRLVARLEGVSAEIHSQQTGALSAKPFASGDSSQMAEASFAVFKPGTEAEYITRDRHRVVLRIVSRQSLTDRSIPDNAAIMDVAPASTAKVVTFVWGDWLYRAEINDKGVEPEVVVQKIL